MVYAQIWWTAAAAGVNNQTNLQIRKNGTTQLAITQIPLQSASGNTVIVSRIVSFNGSTDYVDITAYTANTTSQDIQGGNGSFF